MGKIEKQFGKERLDEAVRCSNSFVEVTYNLGLDVRNVKTISRSIRKLGISCDHFDTIKRLNGSKNRFNEEELKIIVENSKNYNEVLEKLDMSYDNITKLKQFLYNHKIDCSHLKYQKKGSIIWDKETLTLFIKESKTKKEVLEKMNIRSAGSNFYILQFYINLYNLDISHFVKNYEMMINVNRARKISLDKILIKNSTYSRTLLKDRLYKEGLKERKCEICGQNEDWNGRKMSLILDHVNGIHNDHRFENLRIVCPNCNATLETHCGKNRKKGRKVEKNKIEKIKIFKNNKSKRNKIEYNISRRLVERPPFEELKKEIELLGLEGTGRKYNVSGVAIKKWVKTYEKYGK